MAPCGATKVDYEYPLEKFECHKKRGDLWKEDLQDSQVVIKQIVILAK